MRLGFIWHWATGLQTSQYSGQPAACFPTCRFLRVGFLSLSWSWDSPPPTSRIMGLDISSVHPRWRFSPKLCSLTFSPQSTCQQMCITCGPLRNCLQSSRGSKVACTSLVPCDPIEPGQQAKQRLPSLLASPFPSFDHHSSHSYPSHPVMHRFRQEIVREEIIWPLSSTKGRNVRFESQDTSHSARP